MRGTPASDRTRFVSEPVATVGGLARILQGAFGVIGNPRSGHGMEQVSLDAQKVGGIYQLFEADIFTPGTGNWVVDPSFDGPLMTIWGHAFLRRANQFNPIQPPQVYTAAASYLYGIGGQVPGQFITQPLSDPGGQS